MFGLDWDHPLTRTGILAAVFFLLLILENVLPLREVRRGRAGRYASNFVITLLAFIAGSLAVRPLALLLAGLAEDHGIGLLRLVDLSPGVRVLLSFLLMDLTFYYWHRANHTVGFLRRFHVVHHIDPDLDTTTSFRFHPGEILISSGFRAVQVLVLGIDPWTYLFFELVFSCATVFHHSNLRLPLMLERILNLVVVTPRMHGIHHSTVPGETNSNYSVISLWWDAIHRSLILHRPAEEVEIGVRGYLMPRQNGILPLLATPVRAGIPSAPKPPEE